MERLASTCSTLFVQWQLRGGEFCSVYFGFGSAAPVRLLELRTYDLHLMPTSACTTVGDCLENELLRTAVEL